MSFDRLRHRFISITLLFVALVSLGRQAACPQTEDKPTKFFLPQNPIAAAYVLSRFSNQELINAPRGEFVYSALLQRSGLAPKYRLEALDGLAALRHSDRLTQSLLAITELDKKGDEATNSLQDLPAIVMQFPLSHLSPHHPPPKKIPAAAP